MNKNLDIIFLDKDIKPAFKINKLMVLQGCLIIASVVIFLIKNL